MTDIPFSENIELVSKKFNFPGLEAHYLFKILLDAGIKLKQGRIYV